MAFVSSSEALLFHSLNSLSVKISQRYQSILVIKFEPWKSRVTNVSDCHMNDSKRVNMFIIRCLSYSSSIQMTMSSGNANHETLMHTSLVYSLYRVDVDGHNNSETRWLGSGKQSKIRIEGQVEGHNSVSICSGSIEHRDMDLTTRKQVKTCRQIKNRILTMSHSKWITHRIIRRRKAFFKFNLRNPLKLSCPKRTYFKWLFAAFHCQYVLQ
jgi:hypothetical protein